MERAPPPSRAAAALAALDDVLMDKPLSPKRPRQDDPPNPRWAQEPPRHAHVRIIANSETTACMLACNMQYTHTSHHHPHPHPHPPHHTS
eukprot:scaffold129948_cov33-Tisochrysis_lutea.AAC.4